MKEGLVRRIPKTAELRTGLQNYLEKHRPNLRVGHIGDIKFGELYDKYGITTYLFDRDGTLTDYHSSRVPERVKANIARGRQELHERGVELQIGIMTNTPPSDETSFVGLNYVAEQVNAETVIVPENNHDRKPSQIMPLKGLSFFYNRFGTKPSEIAVVGDKLSADVQSAANTGLFSIHVDHKKMGDRDHVGDKWARRHYERMLHLTLGDSAQELPFPELSLEAQRLISEVSQGSVGSFEQVIYDGDTSERESALSPDWISEEIRPLWENSRIAGFGAEPIVLPQDVLSLLGTNGDTEGTSDSLKNKIISKIGSAVHSGIENYGGDIADALADYRSKVAGPAAAVAILNDNNAQAIGWALSAAVADLLDGGLARRSRRGATSEGAKKDNEADKEFSRLVKEALLEKYPDLQEEFDAISASDDHMTRVARPEMQEEGIKTPAVEDGKEAAAIDLATDILLMTSFMERHPIIRRRMKRYASNKKKARIDASKRIWRQEHEEFEEGKAALLARAKAT